MRVAVIGLGAVGARAARQLASTDGVEAVLLRDDRPERLDEVAASLGPVAVAEPAAITAPPEADAVVLAVPAGDHAARAAELVERDVPVVSVSDSMADARALLDLGPLAAARGVPIVVGAAFSPGMTCVLARHAAAELDEVDEVHVARLGTGGPACARQHHRALGGTALDWRDGGWLQRPGGSGRELCWFPDPVGAADCYRAALPDALLLVNAFPGVDRVTARLAATRRDRLTARLPMLRKPHPEGAVGAVRVEVRGRRGTRREAMVLGAMDRPAVAAGAVAAVAAVLAARGELRAPGAAGLAELVEPVPFLAELARRGVKAAVFEGAN
jgi:saccharopine dehydrogenase-like NADP-dependent oxidoreductase